MKTFSKLLIYQKTFQNVVRFLLTRLHDNDNNKIKIISFTIVSTSDPFDLYNMNVDDKRCISSRDNIHTSLNIDFLKESSLFWLIYNQSSRILWFDTIGFSYPKLIFEVVLFKIKAYVVRWASALFCDLYYVGIFQYCFLQ